MAKKQNDFMNITMDALEDVVGVALSAGTAIGTVYLVNKTGIANKIPVKWRGPALLAMGTAIRVGANMYMSNAIVDQALTGIQYAGIINIAKSLLPEGVVNGLEGADDLGDVIDWNAIPTAGIGELEGDEMGNFAEDAARYLNGRSDYSTEIPANMAYNHNKVATYAMLKGGEEHAMNAVMAGLGY